MNIKLKAHLYSILVILVMVVLFGLILFYPTFIAAVCSLILGIIFYALLYMMALEIINERKRK